MSTTKLLLTSIFLLASTFLMSQGKLTGQILEEKTNAPIPFATIYINGTTTGTISDSLGNFNLRTRQKQVELVVSHVSYNTKALQLNFTNNKNLCIHIQPKKLQINEVVITDKNKRAANLRIFRDLFLGSDIWGMSATIKNEEALKFHWEYRNQTVYYNSKGQIMIPYDLDRAKIDCTSIQKIPWRLTAEADEPLIIALPKTGYELHMNLIAFAFQRRTPDTEEQSGYLGYYYFKELPCSSKWKKKQITRNRNHAYYNSAQHFCRSLYNKRLKENGYKIFEKTEKNGKPFFQKANIDSLAH